MDSNYIYEARKYKNENQWKKAIENFEKQKNQNLEIEVEDSLIYAHCLFMDGQIGRAKNELLSLLKKNNKNEEALYQLLIIYDNQSAWKEAFDVIKQLLTIDSSNPDYYFYMGRINSYLKNNEEAKNNYINGLLFKHETNYEKLVEMIQKECFPEYEEIDSSYVFMGGKNNLGAFVHKVNNEQFITKITKIGNGSKKETTFYEELVLQFPQIQDAVPRFIRSVNMNDINYLTVERIRTEKQKKYLTDVVKASQIISSIPYHDIINKFPNSNYNYKLKNRANYITPFFTNIHKKEYNLKLFESLKKYSVQKKYPTVLLDILSYLENLVMNHELYSYIIPEKHYSLLHGDFQPSNMIFDKEHQKIKVIDWPTYKVGPKVIDIARYFQASSTVFGDIQTYFLDEDDMNKLDVIEKIFFLYAYILFHFLVLRHSDMYLRLSQYILPALNELDQLTKIYTCESYKNNSFFFKKILLDINLSVIEDMKKLKKTNKTLKKTNRKLESETISLKARLHNLETKNKDREIKKTNKHGNKSKMISALLKKLKKQKYN